MKFDTSVLKWIREPERHSITDRAIDITTEPHTDLWQRTYYHFRNDNAPILVTETEERFFSFTVKASFDYKARFDQCGIALYIDSENWLKASIEYENGEIMHLGAVVTNNGYSDWSTVEISADTREIWYRLCRRGDDFRIGYSLDGILFRQMRICHLCKGGGMIRFGVYACSPEDSSFTARFEAMELGECKWAAHDGQPPDGE